MDPQDADLNLRDYLRILRRRAPMIIGLTILGALIGYLWASTQPQRYAASADVRILDPNAEAVFDGQTLRIDPKREVDTQIEIIESAAVRTAADETLGDRADEVDTVLVSNVADTDIVKIRVESTDPEVARDGADAIANAYVEARRAQTVSTLEARATGLRDKAAEFRSRVAEIDAAIAFAPDSPEVPSFQSERDSLLTRADDYEERAAELESTADLSSGNAEVVDPAQLPTGPFDPRPTRSAVLGALLGLLIGVSGAFVIERLTDEVTPDNVSAIVGAPVLGTIPLRSSRRLRRHHLPATPRSIAERESASAEAFRSLRTSVRFSNLGKEKRVLAVTSASGSEGKSTVTANLALALAEAGLRVVAISGDLRRPTLASFFGIEDTDAGLTSVLLGDLGLIDSLV
ncbi:MAG: P-loop NTPase, partial [Acidimicrobiales bacterium]|nr:P-loop NTPase [Acidimicrobiales bacterium]